MIAFQLIKPGSVAHQQMIRLRERVLLQPIGVPFSYIKPEAEENDLLVVAYEKETIVGCCVLSPKSNGLIQLRQMAVEDRLQGTGLGKKIITFAEDAAKKHGFDTLYMHARNPVIPFYQKSGYRIAGDEFFEVGIGHHKMEKQL